MSRMKKNFLLLFGLILAFSVHAQDPMLARIKVTNSSVNSLESDVYNKIIKSNKETIREGKLYYVKGDQFAAYFDSGDYMVINKNRMKIDIGLFHGKFKLGNDGALRSLSNVFLYGFQGRCEELAAEHDYNIESKKEGQTYKVVFSTKKKRLIGIGYQQITFKYNINSLLLQEITLVDYKGTRDIYSISNMKYNTKVGLEKFNI